MNKRQTLGVTFIILCFALYGLLSVLEAINQGRYITLGRLREINAIFEQHMRGEVEITEREMNDLIKEYHKPIKEVKE